MPWRTVYEWPAETNRPRLDQAVKFHEALKAAGLIAPHTTIQEFFREQIGWAR
jgi:hypothetical protein